MKAAASPFGQDHLTESWARGRDEFKALPRQGLSKLESTPRRSRLNTFSLLSWESRDEKADTSQSGQKRGRDVQAERQREHS